MWCMLTLAALTAAPELKDVVPKVRLAVMPIAAGGLPEEYASGLTETIASHVAATGVFDTISPRQIASILAYEKRKEVLGSCASDECYAQVASIVRADHLIGGSVAKVGERLVLNLVLVDAKSAAAPKRVTREADAPAELIDGARSAAIVVLQPILSERRGYLKVVSNVAEAQLFVDDERRAESFGQVLALSAGPHTLKVVKDGFYTATADVLISPTQVVAHEITLVPARETIESYELKASALRYGAYATGALAVGAAIASAVFYSSATDDKALVDQFANSLQIEQQAPGFRDAALEAKDSFDVNQSLYVGTLGAAVGLGVTALVMYLVGDDPDRYEEFHELEAP